MPSGGFNKRVCKKHGCDIVFQPKTKKHAFCCRRCFITNYRSKDEDFGFPEFTCPGCKKKIKMTFSPLTDPKKWSEYRCYHCGYRNSENDYNEIEKIKRNWKTGG